jgi:hypothetical protein
MTNPPTPEPTPSVMKFGDLKKLIADTVESVTKAGQAAGNALTGNDNPPARVPLRDQVRGGSQPAPRRSIDDEFSAALKKIEEDKKRQEREANLDKDIADLKERTKENPPLERSRVHRFMGWGE